LCDLWVLRSHGDKVLGGSSECLGLRCWRSCRCLAVGQSDIRGKQRHVGTSLPLRLNWVLRSLIRDVAGDGLLLGLLRILRASGTKHASLLGKSALRHQLLAL